MAPEVVGTIGSGFWQVNGARAQKENFLSIFDPYSGDPAPVSFDELANALLEQGETASPAELHGCLCGLLGGGAPENPEHLVPEIEKTLDVRLQGELAQATRSLCASSLEPLLEGDFDFYPLLPEDDLELAQRVTAMADWCRAFLSGYAQARVRADAAGKAVAPDSAEALRDFAAIAQAAFDDEDGEDEAERQYEELVEYLRVAAMNVLMDASAGKDEAGPGDRGDG
ncbi:MAG: hypothetical protein ACI87W_000677 [Halieaceae bacterium]